MTNLGERLEPILCAIEDAIWEHELVLEKPIDFSNKSFRAIVKIFATAMMDKEWDLQEAEGIEMIDRETMAEECGREIRRLVKTFTNIDTQDFYK
jgi:hypothetical protein